MNTLRLYAIANYMKNRHQIFLKRKAGEPGPWTQDPILAEGRFCNVYRELDTVTIWIEENIRKPYADHPHLWFMLCIARYINWPPTLAVLIDLAENENVPAWPSHPDFDCGEAFIATEPGGFDASSMTWALHQIAKTGKKVYTGAYMIRAESNEKAVWYNWSKHKYIAEIVLGRLWEDRAEWAELLEPSALSPSLQQVWSNFQESRYIGWGPFMAYEVVTDLRHTRYLRDADDIYTWANAGPGAIRGLNRLYGRELKAKPHPKQTNEEMMTLMIDLNDYHEDPLFNEVLGPAMDSDPPRFEMRDIEHTLCEFDKYERVRLGEGRMRSKFNYRAATDLNQPGVFS